MNSKYPLSRSISCYNFKSQIQWCRSQEANSLCISVGDHKAIAFIANSSPGLFQHCLIKTYVICLKDYLTTVFAPKRTTPFCNILDRTRIRLVASVNCYISAMWLILNILWIVAETLFWDSHSIIVEQKSFNSNFNCDIRSLINHSTLK